VLAATDPSVRAPNTIERVVVNRALLDTDIVSELLKGQDLDLGRRAASYRDTFGLFTISLVTLMELSRALLEVGREAEVARLVRLVEAEAILSPDVEVVAEAARIYADLVRGGRPASWPVSVLAAQALRHGLELVTASPDTYEPIARLGYPLMLGNWKR
jgi:tRNA(fMet)-specific endonuclease VapC